MALSYISQGLPQHPPVSSNGYHTKVSSRTRSLSPPSFLWTRPSCKPCPSSPIIQTPTTAQKSVNSPEALLPNNSATPAASEKRRHHLRMVSMLTSRYHSAQAQFVQLERVFHASDTSSGRRDAAAAVLSAASQVFEGRAAAQEHHIELGTANYGHLYQVERWQGLVQQWEGVLDDLE